MSTRFSPEATVGLADAERRARAAEWAQSQPLPSPESEEWRYSPIEDLDLEAFSPQVRQPIGTAPAASPVGDDDDAAAHVVLINGYVTQISLQEGWAAKGLAVAALAQDRPEPTEGETAKFDALHLAFAPHALQITVPRGLAVDQPVVIHHHHTGGGVAAFAHVVVEAGEASQLRVVERQTSNDDAALTIALTELSAGPGANLDYYVVQNLGRATHQIQRIKSVVADHATARTAIAAFGGAYARVRTDTDLVGAGAAGDLAAAYYADGRQSLDFRTFQHHRNHHTTSDLLFKGVSDDEASSIYTGLIHIHEQGAGSNAHQTNRNIKLGDNAWAWSVPNLEIENNDVRCSHASTVSPIDVDQQFYLQARGVPPRQAEELVVAGFFADVIERFALPALRAEVQALIEAKLVARSARAQAEA